MVVLCLLNIVPTQLHPNNWASLHAFRIVCKYLSLTLTPEVFLYFYSSRPDKRSGWLSMISRSKTCLLSPFTPYKNFKGGFFKTLIEEVGKSIFMTKMFQSFLFY